MALDPKRQEDSEPEPGPDPVDLGSIAGDDPVLLQGAHPAQARRGRQRDRLGEVDVGDAPVLLEAADDGTIGGVNCSWRHSYA